MLIYGRYRTVYINCIREVCGAIIRVRGEHTGILPHVAFGVKNSSGKFIVYAGRAIYLSLIYYMLINLCSSLDCVSEVGTNPEILLGLKHEIIHLLLLVSPHIV